MGMSETQTPSAGAITTTTFATLHGISESTARRWARTGRVPAIKIGRTWKYQVTQSLPQRIRETIASLAPAGHWVSMIDLRAAMGIDRDTLDTALIEELGARRIRMTEEANRRLITPDLAAAALTAPGAQLHWIMLMPTGGDGLEGRVCETLTRLGSYWDDNTLVTRTRDLVSADRIRTSLSDAPAENINRAIQGLIRRGEVEQIGDSYRTTEYH